MSEKVIEARNLTKKFNNIVAVDNLHLNVFRGDVFGFLGPNGAGKSTTIRMLLSLIAPTSGEIFIFGKSLKKHRLEILKNVGAIVEKPDFYLFLTAYKNLEILSRLSGIEVTKNQLMEKLEFVGLKERHNSKVKTFSHGMKQRLGIAQALLHDPDLIILDEPTTGLDPQGVKEIRDLIISLSSEHSKTILLSSHLLSEVQLIASRMIIINKGSTQIEGNVSDLLSSKEMTVEIGAVNIDDAMNHILNSSWKEFFSKKEQDHLVFKMRREEIPELNRFLIEKDVSVVSIIPRNSLEEYFLNITGKSKND